MVGNEEARLAALYGYGVLDAARPAALDELTALTAGIFGVPTVTVSLVDRDRVWFAGNTGWPADQNARATSFSHHLVGGTALAVPDARVHPVLRVTDGSLRFLAGAPIVDADGHVLGGLCITDTYARDFSPAQLGLLGGLAGQAARHLAAHRDRLEHERVLAREEDLVAAISHELRTPITVMQGYLEALHDEEDLIPYRSMLEPVQRSGDRLVRMVDHLLTGTQPDAAVIIRPGRLDLRCVAQAAVAGCAAPARARDVRIRLEAVPGPLPVSGDFGRLCQVAEQLLRNAVAFSAEGGEVVVRVTGGAEPAIEVADQGEGIPADELPHVPERFYRGRYARENAVPGIGLGLSIATGIVRAHGGSLSIDSPGGGGGGTTALLRMPALRQRPEQCTAVRQGNRARPRTPLLPRQPSLTPFDPDWCTRREGARPSVRPEPLPPRAAPVPVTKARRYASPVSGSKVG